MMVYDGPWRLMYSSARSCRRVIDWSYPRALLETSWHPTHTSRHLDTLHTPWHPTHILTPYTHLDTLHTSWHPTHILTPYTHLDTLHTSWHPTHILTPYTHLAASCNQICRTFWHPIHTMAPCGGMCVCVCALRWNVCVCVCPAVEYSLLHLECHFISVSNLNLLGLSSTERGTRDLKN